MEQFHREWQVLWRELLGEQVDELPDIDCDFILHFDIWDLEQSKLEKCFSVFPNGLKILDRAQQVRDAKIASHFSDDNTVLALLDAMNERVASVLRQSPIISDNKRVIRGDDEKRQEVFAQADPITIDLDDSFSQIIQTKLGDKAYAAYFFLSEPLYRLTDYYQVAYWVIWPMLEDLYEIEPYEPGYELYKMNAQAGHDHNGLFIFINN